MNILVEKYILHLKNAYCKQRGQQKWIKLEEIKESINRDNYNKIKTIYPKVPQLLLDFFEFTDGSNYRGLKGIKENIDENSFWQFFGSDCEKLPYYLKSSSEIIEDPNFVKDCFDYLEKEDYDIFDEKIDNNTFNWLNFADDFYNNGGLSQLFIDFSPSSKGKVGQIIRYSHDPDELVVISDSFEKYLQQIIYNGFNFIDEKDI